MHNSGRPMTLRVYRVDSDGSITELVPKHIAARSLLLGPVLPRQLTCHHSSEAHPYGVAIPGSSQPGRLIEIVGDTAYAVDPDGRVHTFPCHLIQDAGPNPAHAPTDL